MGLGLDPESEKASGEGAETPTGNTEEEEEDEEEEESVPGCTLFIKNLNFSTTEETLKEVSEMGGGGRRDVYPSLRHAVALGPPHPPQGWVLTSGSGGSFGLPV